jgi:hypothetical protein
MQYPNLLQLPQYTDHSNRFTVDPGFVAHLYYSASKIALGGELKVSSSTITWTISQGKTPVYIKVMTFLVRR